MVVTLATLAETFIKAGKVKLPEIQREKVISTLESLAAGSCEPDPDLSDDLVRFGKEISDKLAK